MRNVLWSALVGVSLLLILQVGAGSADPSLGHASSLYAGDAGSLVTHLIPGEGRDHALLVLDPRRQALGVYHVDPVSGKVTLRSVRNLSWDLQMTDFNCGDPLPQDIRSGLGQ